MGDMPGQGLPEIPQPNGTNPPVPTPALRFLYRGKQLLRLQDPIIKKAISDTIADRDALAAAIPTEESQVKNYVAMIPTSLSRSVERLADLQLMLQLFLSRHADNFQTFLDDLIRAILTAKPGLLKRGEEVPLQEVLSHSTMESFIEDAIERKILKLAYKSLRDMQKAVREEFQFDLFPQPMTASRVELLFDVRNLITHNSGYVTKRFKDRWSTPGLVVGQQYPLSLEEIKAWWEMLSNASTDIEERARRKFKIPQRAEDVNT